MPNFDNIHTLSVSRSAINAITFSKDGDWIALGCASLGQLLVWEWRSESYILKQQGHYYDISTSAFSPDGTNLATGADDAKVRPTPHIMPHTSVAVDKVICGHQFIKQVTLNCQEIIAWCMAASNVARQHIRFIGIVEASLNAAALGWCNSCGCMLSEPAHLRPTEPVQNLKPDATLLPYNSLPCCTGLSWLNSACQIALLTLVRQTDTCYSARNLQVKIWNVQSGFCFVTFSDHTAPVTAVAFLPSGSVVITASLDGTVRAFDLIRYRNFRTMTSPHPVQFVSLAVDPAGEVKTPPHHLNPPSTCAIPPHTHLT